MTEKEVLLLVGVIAAHDKRELTQNVVAVWREAARDGRWQIEPAIAAVKRFFRTPLEPGKSRPWLDPGHVEHLIRVMRPGGTGPAPAGEVLGPRQQRPASPELRARLRESVTFELEAKRGRPSRVQARRPWWEPREDAPALEAGPVSPQSVREQLRALTRKRPGGPSEAFTGRPG